MLAAVFLAVLALAPTKAPARSDVGEAKRLYTLGERHMGEGRASDAITLWRQAIQLLPVSADYDELRHDLVMRLGYGLLATHHATNELRYLVEAQRMLLRYVERHEKLVGPGARAKTERDEVYEQLYEVESRLGETSDAGSITDPIPPTDPLPEVRPAAKKRVASDKSRTIVKDDGEVFRREIHVDTRKREAPTVEDKKIRGELDSPKTSPETGLWLTRTGMGTEVMSAARPYVRVYGPARSLVGNGRARDQKTRQALAVGTVRSVRDGLLLCYASAYARDPDKNVVMTELELSIGADGRVRHAKIIGNAVVDDRGSRCVTRHLASAQAPKVPGRTHRLRVPVVFFWQSEKPNFDTPASQKHQRGPSFEMQAIEAPHQITR